MLFTLKIFVLACVHDGKAHTLICTEAQRTTLWSNCSHHQIYAASTFNFGAILLVCLSEKHSIHCSLLPTFL